MHLFLLFKEELVDLNKIKDVFENNPIIAATDSSGWSEALNSEAEVLFHLSANILTASDEIGAAKNAGKQVFIHIDLADGIGKDKVGICWLKRIGADGIISTREKLIKSAKEFGLLTVQRFFALDSKGMNSIFGMIESARPDFVEIMPGVIPKAVRLLSTQDIPVIAGGLIESKNEVTAALGNGAIAISTGRHELWSGV